MQTRLKTRNAQEDAVQSVLSNPDLVALILERLPISQLILGCHGKDILGNTDRWAASQVNKVFREAALRLPWEARWGEHWYSDSAASLRALAALKPRAVQAWTVQLAHHIVTAFEQTNANSAAILNSAHGTERLTLRTRGELYLESWLHHTLVPLPEAQGGSMQGTPVLACLASLSRLTSLQVLYASSSEGNADASWVTVMKKLKCIKLSGYRRPPLADLPALDSLCMVLSCSQGPLEEWVSPRMTALSLRSVFLQLGLPPGGDPAQTPHASGSNARDWLSRLQRLELNICSKNDHNTTGLRELVPSLTYLQLSWYYLQGPESMTLLLTKGLPVGLLSLHVQGPNPVWSAVFELPHLVSLKVWQTSELAVGEKYNVAAVVTGLTRLPRLKTVSLRLPLGDSYAARVQERFRPLDALLLKRQGSLQLDLGPPRYDY